jgi:hypothetical protein
MSILPPLPVPPDDWLNTINERYRQQDMPPQNRPFCALKDWAVKNGQSANADNLLLSHLGQSAWQRIDAFFRTQTKLGHERIQPVGRSVWFYDGSFYPLDLFIIVGGKGPYTTINPFHPLAKGGMPNPLLEAFSRDEPRVREYLEHLSNAIDSLQCSALIIDTMKQPFAKQLLRSAEKHLESAVANLLDTPPNKLAADQSRLAFEASLKGLLAEKDGLQEKEAKEISHHLDKAFGKINAGSAKLISDADLAKLKEAAMDSASSAASRKFFADFGARYDDTTLPAQRRLWHCFAAAQHAFATVLRVFGASDSRQLN